MPPAKRSREADASQPESQLEPSDSPNGSQSDPSAAPGSSAGSSAAADEFFADRGQPFDPEQADEEPPYGVEPDEQPALEPVLWTPERVRRLLVMQGQLTHTAVGVAETDWVWLDRELDMVCGPLADHANRVPALAALAHISDDAAIAAGFVSYLMRSWLERTRELQARRRAQAAQPVTGRAVGPDDIPGEEPQWQT